MENYTASSYSVRIPPAESSVAAFAASWSEDAARTLCAFLNGWGGRIFVGVSETGDALGLENPEESEKAVRETVRSRIFPLPEAYVRTRIGASFGKTVLVVTVLAGKAPPYYAEDAGGVRTAYVRHGSRTEAADDAEIRALCAKADPRSYEEAPALRQDLTFASLESLMAEAGEDCSQKAFARPGLRDADGFFTNAALILSDESSSVTKLAFVDGTSAADPVRETEVFTGSAAAQYAGMRGRLKDALCGETKAGPLYPVRSVLEALQMLFAFRDYGLPVPAKVTVYADRAEFAAFGAMPRGARDMLAEGALIPRNRVLAEVLLQLFYRDRIGLGLPAVFASYEDCAYKPELSVGADFVHLTLPSRKAGEEKLSEAELRAVEWMRLVSPARRCDIQSYLQASYGTTAAVLRSLIAKNVIRRVGGGKNTVYELL
jgi:ATP-dependent DNA helicase RecG